MELFSPSLKFFPGKTFLCFFLEKITLESFLTFSQKKFFLYFVKWNFLAPSLKKLLIFLEGTL